MQLSVYGLIIFDDMISSEYKARNGRKVNQRKEVGRDMFQGICLLECRESTKVLCRGSWCTKPGFNRIKVKTISLSDWSQIQMSFGLQCTDDLEA